MGKLLLALVLLAGATALAQDEPPAGVSGETVYQENCTVCHGNQGQGGIGPALVNNASLEDTAQVVNQILHGGGGMPGFANQLSTEQVAAVASYIRTNFENSFGDVTVETVQQIEGEEGQDSQDQQNQQNQQDEQDQQEEEQQETQQQEAQAQEQEQQEVTAEIIDADGNQVGTATLSRVSVDGTQAVRVSVELNEFTQAQAGMHGIHLHAVGECEPPNFSSAGSHFSPVGNNHGYLSQGGPHAGDLPNIQIDEQGNASYEWVTDLVSLSEGERALSDADGAAIVIHAQQDDYRSDPGGSSGPMIACGVIYQAGE